jgi:hypothetical protein
MRDELAIFLTLQAAMEVINDAKTCCFGNSSVRSGHRSDNRTADQPNNNGMAENHIPALALDA